jgi:DNA polymerase type B, organellar and viral
MSHQTPAVTKINAANGGTWKVAPLEEQAKKPSVTGLSIREWLQRGAGLKRSRDDDDEESGRDEKRFKTILPSLSSSEAQVSLPPQNPEQSSHPEFQPDHQSPGLQPQEQHSSGVEVSQPTEQEILQPEVERSARQSVVQEIETGMNQQEETTAELQPPLSPSNVELPASPVESELGLPGSPVASEVELPASPVPSLPPPFLEGEAEELVNQESNEPEKPDVDSQDVDAAAEDDPSSQNSGFEVLDSFERAAPELGVTEKNLHVNLHPDWRNLDESFYQIISEVVNKLKSGFLGNYRVNLTISGVRDEDSVPIELNFTTPEELHGAAVFTKLGEVCQSNQSFAIDQELHFRCVGVKLPEMGHPTKNLSLLASKGIVQIKCSNVFHEHTKNWARADAAHAQTQRKNFFCAPGAMVLGRIWLEMKKNPTDTKLKGKYMNERRQVTRYFASEVDQLMNAARVDLRERKATREDIEKLADVFSHPVVFYRANDDRRELILFDSLGSKGDNIKPVEILVTDQHCDLLVNSSLYFGKKSICQKCRVPLLPHRPHRCPDECKKCYGICADGARIERRCDGCQFDFYNHACYQMHKLPHHDNEKPRCDVIKLCRLCGTVYSTEDEHQHICGIIDCRQCKKRVPIAHTCYIQKLSTDTAPFEVTSRHTIVTYYDIETYVDSENVLRVCLIASFTSCHFCRDGEEPEPRCCGKRKNLFSKLYNTRIEPAEEFVKWASRLCVSRTRENGQRTGRRHHILLAHNGSRFDSLFVLKAISGMDGWHVVDTFGHGRKLNKIVCENSTKCKITLLDTMSFVPASLSNMAAAFGIPEVKGFFPHKMTKEENFGMILHQLPAAENYSPQRMHPKQRQEFSEWHVAESHRMRTESESWILASELIKYCEQDVVVLFKSFEKFRKQCLDFGVDPIVEGCHTLPMVSFAIYRKLFMPANSIARIPPNGYRLADNQSKMALLYLTAIEIRDKINIQHAAKCREVILNGIPVDGVWEHDGIKTVFQVTGLKLYYLVS